VVSGSPSVIGAVLSSPDALVDSPSGSARSSADADLDIAS
jgi:hypothetical protein